MTAETLRAAAQQLRQAQVKVTVARLLLTHLGEPEGAQASALCALAADLAGKAAALRREAERLELQP